MGAATFASSSGITPGAAGSEGQEINPVESIISQGGEQPDPNLGGGLQDADDQSDGAVEGGLDFNEDQPLEAGNDELGGLNGELGNLENEYQHSDASGDIINPMEEAEYYQGSFQEDDPHFAEYRSQGSDEEDNLGGHGVEVGDIDEPPEDMNLREPASTTPGEVNGPRSGLHIAVDDADEDAADADAAAKISEMAEQVDNPYLLHYKNRSAMLKQELMGEPAATMAPSHDPQRDPEEEFFMLAVLALKMLHNEQYEDAEYVYEVSAAKLFRQVRSQ